MYIEFLVDERSDVTITSVQILQTITPIPSPLSDLYLQLRFLDQSGSVLHEDEFGDPRLISDGPPHSRAFAWVLVQLRKGMARLEIREKASGALKAAVSLVGHIEVYCMGYACAPQCERGVAGP